MFVPHEGLEEQESEGGKVEQPGSRVAEKQGSRRRGCLGRGRGRGRSGRLGRTRNKEDGLRGNDKRTYHRRYGDMEGMYHSAEGGLPFVTSSWMSAGGESKPTD